MQVARSLIPNITTLKKGRTACVLVFARGNATSTGTETSHTKRNGTAPLKKGGSNFGALLTERAQKFEHKDVLVIPSENIRQTYIELKKKVDGYSIGLYDDFIREGDTFVSAVPDVSAGLYIQLAAARSNVVYVPFSPNVPLETFLSKLKSSNARGFLVPDVYGNRNYILDLYNAIPEIDAQRLDMPTRFSSLDYPKLRLRGLWSKDGKDYHGFDAIHRTLVTSSFRSPLPKLESLTTEKPVLLLPQEDTLNFDAVSQLALVNTGHAILEALSVNINDRISLSVPYNSIGYFLAAGSISHGTVFIQAGSKFAADATLKTISRDKATILFIGEADLAALQKDLKRHDLSTLRTIVVLGKLNASAIQIAKELGAKEVFGLEYVKGHTGQLTGLIRSAEGKAALLPGAEAKVVDGQGNTVSLGKTGSIKTKGFHVLSGGDGWLDTQLQGTLDKDGVVTLQ